MITRTAWNKGKKLHYEVWNKGKTGVYSEEYLQKISEAKKGNTNMLGHKHSLESRKQMSETKKGKHYSPATEFKKGQVSSMKGRKRPDLIGNPNGFKQGHTPWNKGLGTISSANELARKTKQYRDWRKAVFERDDYTCQECNERGGNLNADHIKQFAYHLELRYDINNGRTLCVDCHRATSTWGFHATNGVFNAASS